MPRPGGSGRRDSVRSHGSCRLGPLATPTSTHADDDAVGTRLVVEQDRVGLGAASIALEGNPDGLLALRR